MVYLFVVVGMNSITIYMLVSLLNLAVLQCVVEDLISGTDRRSQLQSGWQQ